MEQKKKCEICGKIKSANEFSKSYKHRCKACVAEQTRLLRADVVKDAERASQKDNRPFRKAVVKDTGETDIILSNPCKIGIKTRNDYEQHT